MRPVGFIRGATKNTPDKVFKTVNPVLGRIDDEITMSANDH
jgi:hypothetical protein